MFLKRLFLFAALIIGACGGAWAADETGQCVAGHAWTGSTTARNGESTGVYIDGTNQGMYADYIVYFKNNESTIKSGCENDITTMVQAIKAKQDGLRAILTFATADGTGDNAVNKTLSQGRLDTVLDKLMQGRVDYGLLGCSKAEGSTDSDQVCANFYLGDAPWNDKESQFQRRAVYIFLIYKDIGTLCGEKMKDALNTLKTKLSAYDEGNDVRKKLKDVTDFCSDVNGVAATSDKINEFETKWKELIEALPRELKNAVSDADLQLKIAKVQLLYEKLSAGSSVWKNKDGKFNSYRLMADSVGTVVLGTAGALLSSHLIKKAQVKEGFEDLQCTIGGQLVANWGDEFRPTVQFVQ